jgi:hypothetical protein
MVKRRVLLDHKKNGKLFLPPFLSFFETSSTSILLSKWIDHRLPELLWIGLLIEHYGNKMGTDLSVDLAKIAKTNFTDSGVSFFSFTSAYGNRNKIEMEKVLFDLDHKHILDFLRDGLYTLCLFYPLCPFCFLYDIKPVLYDISERRVYLEKYKSILMKYYDRFEKPAAIIQTTCEYINLSTGKMQISKDIPKIDFNTIFDYPETDESKRTASFMRASVNATFGCADVPPTWAEYFWNRGLEIEKCEYEKIWREYEI